MKRISLENIIKHATSFSFRKAPNGSITISFSTFNTTLIDDIKSADGEEIIIPIMSTNLNFYLTGYNHRNEVYYFTLQYTSTDKSQTVRSFMFDTINKNVKSVYDSSFNYFPYLAGYQDADIDVYIVVVDNIYGIDGWRASQILQVVYSGGSAGNHIYFGNAGITTSSKEIVIPSSLDYSLKSFRVSSGQNILSVVRSLFPNVALKVYKFGDKLHIRPVKSSSPMLSSYGNICDETEVSREFNIDAVVLKGSQSTPEYIEGQCQDMTLVDNEIDGFSLYKNVRLNKIGREFMITEQTDISTLTSETREARFVSSETTTPIIPGSGGEGEGMHGICKREEDDGTIIYTNIGCGS